MLRLLCDVAPIYPEHERIRIIPKVVTDTIDTVAGPAQPFADGIQGGGSHTLPWLFGAIAAALIALGFCLFMVRLIRKRTEQQVGFSAA